MVKKNFVLYESEKIMNELTVHSSGNVIDSC